MNKTVIKKMVRELLDELPNGMLIHTAFRKASDSDNACDAYDAIEKMSDDDYNSIVYYINDGLSTYLASNLRKKLKGKQ